MSATSAISSLDLSQLPAPAVVEQLDFETIFAAMLTDLRARDPIFDALVESDPAYKILQFAAFREMNIRARVNDAAKAVMLAFATGTDLDHLGANKNLPRLVLDPGNPAGSPPIPPTYETDADFRMRIQLAPEGYSTAGPEGSYVFHARSAAAAVKDAQAISPEPGRVTVYVLSRVGFGTASPELIEQVEAALSADDVRPLTDHVTVESAEVSTYDVVAELVMFPGPDAEVVRQAAQVAVTAYTQDVHRLGYDVTLSGLFRALHQNGVQGVNLIEPVSNLVAGDGEAWCVDAINVTIAAATDV